MLANNHLSASQNERGPSINEKYGDYYGGQIKRFSELTSEFLKKPIEFKDSTTDFTEMSQEEKSECLARILELDPSVAFKDYYQKLLYDQQRRGENPDINCTSFATFVTTMAESLALTPDEHEIVFCDGNAVYESNKLPGRHFWVEIDGVVYDDSGFLNADIYTGHEAYSKEKNFATSGLGDTYNA